MEQEDLVLNLHGEIPSDADTVRQDRGIVGVRLLTSVQNVCVLNAEPAFLPHLRKIHERFPKLRIVLEHATTRAAVEAVKECGPTVACTITAHHIALTVDDWAGQAWNFCKPVAKYPDDRMALREVIESGEQFTRSGHEVLISQFSRAPTIFPRFGLSAASAARKINSDPSSAVCSWGVYLPHPPPSRCTSPGVIWSPQPLRRVCEYFWPFVLQTRVAWG